MAAPDLPQQAPVVVHDRDRLNCDLLADHLSTIEDLKVVGSASTFDGVLSLVDRHKPTMVVSQVGLPPLGESARLTAALHERHPEVSVVVIGSAGNPVTQEEYREAGADECLLREADLDDLEETLRDVLSRKSGR